MVVAVYRLHWEIELAFERLKSLPHIDQLPTRTDRGPRSWLYARLILALLCGDLSQDFLEFSPEDMLDTVHISSLWPVQKAALLMLPAVALGPLSPINITTANTKAHRHLANAPRKRKPHIGYPVRALF